jgi:hypothetical protein
LFQWMLFTGIRDPRTLQYYMLFGVKQYSSFAALHEAERRLDEETFRRRIIHISRDLVEVVQENTIQVIHESVRDWLLYGTGFNQLDGSIKNAEGDGSIAITDTCINVLLAKDFFPIHPERQKLFRAKGIVRGKFWDASSSMHIPNLSAKDIVIKFTWYAIDNVLQFALRAEKCGTLPVRFLDLLSTVEPLWRIMMSAGTDSVLRLYSPQKSPLTLLCSMGFTSSLFIYCHMMSLDSINFTVF